ncbi:DUF1413 domain-containing protein [Palleronia sp.]|uniref:DUF1413 domain-containing protein n=1 Tax=Palleronia sp. TaxID=1940284 RepID=UPI0035C7BE44
MKLGEQLLQDHKDTLIERIWMKGPGKAFTLPDLFTDDEWRAMSGTDHQNLGKAFYAAIRQPPFENICPTDYPMNPAQQYVHFEPRKKSTS